MSIMNITLNGWCAFRLVCSQSWPALFFSHTHKLKYTTLIYAYQKSLSLNVIELAENTILMLYFFFGKCRAQQQTCEKHKHRPWSPEETSNNRQKIYILHIIIIHIYLVKRTSLMWYRRKFRNKRKITRIFPIKWWFQWKVNRSMCALL